MTETDAGNQNDLYDLCVIGCGPGGFAAAMHALDQGREVCIVEGAQIGGAGVMWGALTSKTMWELSKDYAIAAKVDRGYRAGDLTVDYDALRNTVIKAAKEKQYQMLSQIESFSSGQWEGPGSLTLKRGWAAFSGPDRLEVTDHRGRTEEIKARHLLIATGSKPREFPGIPTDGNRVINSDHVLRLKEFPRRLMIIGAGIIGCEYATIFSNFCQTDVYVVDHKDRVIPYEDEDVSEFVSRNLRANGVKIIHSARLRDIRHEEEYLEVVLDFEDGHSEVVEVDTVLISIGRTPDLSVLQLDRAGITPHERGHLETDADCRVSDRIYAVGDVTDHPALVNIAETEARYAVKHMYDLKRWPINYKNMSTVMFFYPAVASVGLSEKNCQKQKIPYRVGYYSNNLLNRAIAMRATNGFVKIIVSDDEEQTILGMRAAGPQVSSTIVSIAHFMDQGKGVEEVLKLIYPHPTISESIQECLRMLLGTSLYKPRAFPGQLNIRRWTPEGGDIP